MPFIVNKILGFLLGLMSFGLAFLCLGGILNLMKAENVASDLAFLLFFLSLTALTTWGGLKFWRTKPPGESDEAKYRRILEVARCNNGKITALSAAIDAQLEIEESKILLESMVDKGIAVLEVTDQAGLLYCFPDLSLSTKAEPRYLDRL